MLYRSGFWRSCGDGGGADVQKGWWVVLLRRPGVGCQYKRRRRWRRRSVLFRSDNTRNDMPSVCTRRRNGEPLRGTTVEGALTYNTARRDESTPSPPPPTISLPPTANTTASAGASSQLDGAPGPVRGGKSNFGYICAYTYNYIPEQSSDLVLEFVVAPGFSAAAAATTLPLRCRYCQSLIYNLHCSDARPCFTEL